ncbi:glycoside hydrolase family 2 protein [Catenulispora rubra]|uniref:glycoside hydrolase family 2 protein n=1 Tax=Catenulispora rubra TaxID=280293 RepID=UPI0018924B6A|nr:glycoside hydrolase family 2 protein [Catenulispora rubra]
MTAHTVLASGWTLRLASADPQGDGPVATWPQAPIPAAVPGCVHTDLLAAGLIPDPFLDDNETATAWVGRVDWRYQTQLPARDPGYECAEVVFDGLDTVARVEVDGVVLGHTRNMHRGYRFDVSHLPPGGPGELAVEFTSAYQEAEALRDRLGPRPAAYPEPFNYVRKMACSFGWDWGPTLVTAGIWRQARLELWNTARFTDVRALVTVTDGVGRVEVRAGLRRSAGGAGKALRVQVAVADHSTEVCIEPGARELSATIEVADPQLWWPHTLGAQPLYGCEVVLSDAATGEVLDTWGSRVGFRTIVLDTTPDSAGTAFRLVVNGIPVFARGANWIPEDVFPSRVDAARYRARLAQAADVGVDLIRVWGGGIYEDEAFYRACDELGLLVWQDFPFACAAYPEDEPLRGEVEAEARQNVARLTPHPSLALWNGNNENLWGFRDWNWEPELGTAAWGEGYYLGLLPRIVAEVDPTRPYWAGSPWSGSWSRHPNDPGHGTTHSWEVWNRRDYADYLADVPRFVAEFGWQAPPTFATLRRAVHDEPLTPGSPGLLHHQKAEDGQGKLTRGLAPHFGEPDGFDEWHYLTQINQVRAISVGIEHWRSHWPRCAGTILWQLNDCWPAVSWSAIDGDGRAKPLFHELRRLYADRLLTFTERDGQLYLAAVNQGRSPWSTTLTLRRLRTDGVVQALVQLPLRVAPAGVQLVEVPGEVAEWGEDRKELMVADADMLRAWRFGSPDRDFAYPEAQLTITTTPAASGEGTEITVAAHTLVRDLYLQADRLHPAAAADRGPTTLLPGETLLIRVAGFAGDDEDVFAARALWCVNGGAVTRQGPSR